MNRKLLLGTTALVAGGVVAADMAEAADPLRLEVRGYRNEAFGIVAAESDVQNENFNNTNHRSDGEIHFRGSTTLDNGIEVGVRVELEAFTTGDQVDENYVFLEGGFGRLTLGSDDPAPYIQAVVAPNVGAPINSGWLSDFIPEPTGFDTGDFSTTPEISADDNMVTYFSPRFAGFQLGLSYIPDVQDDGEGLNKTADDNDRAHGIGAGINFTRSFGGIDITAAGGIQHVGEPDEEVADADEDITHYNAGVNLGFGGFTFGGSVGVIDDDDSGDEGFAWDLGVSYETGPWGVSGTFILNERDGDGGNGDDEDESIGVAAAVSYVLGPGVKTSFTGMYADYDAEDGGEDGEGIAGVLTLRVDF